MASAEAFYGSSGPGLATWPSVGNGYGASSTVWGAHGYRIGKRSADASHGHGYGHGLVVPAVAVAHVALPTTVESHNNQFGHQGATQYSISQGHPGASSSFQQVSRLHSGIYGGYGKRSADAYYGTGLGYGYGIGVATTLENRNNVHGHELASGYAISQPHPGFAGSYQSRTQLHSGYGKRSADAYYGLAATVENHNNRFGHQGATQYSVSQGHPGASGSYQQVSRLHSGIYGHAGYGLY